jgi:hypothetical protein
MRRQLLGFLACHGCGKEMAGADDRDAWLIVVRLGALERVLCPECKGRVA